MVSATPTASVVIANNSSESHQVDLTERASRRHRSRKGGHHGMITTRWTSTTSERWDRSSSQPRSRWNQVADGMQTGSSRQIYGSRDAHSILPRLILRVRWRPVRLRGCFVHEWGACSVWKQKPTLFVLRQIGSENRGMTLVFPLTEKPRTTHFVLARPEDYTVFPCAEDKYIFPKGLARSRDKPGPRVEEGLEACLRPSAPAIVIVSLNASYRNVVAIAEEMGKLEVG